MRYNFPLLLFMLTLSHALQATDRPNIIYIMSDDMGFSDIGCYGSEIETPNLDELAAGGVRFTQFYNTARCCPTRASLLTGLYPHQAGIGHMMNDRGYDGYRGDLNRNCVTIAEVMRTAGYRTYMSGKWHVTKNIAPKNDAEKHNWPLQRGFDRFYGTIHGAGSFFDPNTLTRDNTYISPSDDSEYQTDQYYYTDAISDHAVRFINDHHFNNGEKPFFMYVAYTAAHWPMHALERDIAKYRGKYDHGYQSTREARYKKMLELGLIDSDSTVNWPIPDEWKEKEFLKWDIVNMEVYAAMVDNMDQGIGRIVESLKATGQYDNTLVCFFQDNGGCAEGMGRGSNGVDRAASASLDPLPQDYLQPSMIPKQTRAGFPMRQGKGVMAGPADTYIGYGRGWATVSNTPFREYKHWTHEGGISTPLIASWPAHITRKGELESTPGHLIDLMATAVDVAGASYPKTFHNGQNIKPMEGKSLVPAFEGKGIQREAIYWEHEGNRAVRQGDYKLVAKGAKGKWELYNIATDRSEQQDLSESLPAKTQQLADLWQAYAQRANVLPLNPNSKKNSSKMNKKQKKFALKQGANLATELAPFVAKKGLVIAADISGNLNGVIAAQGGVTHGWALYVKESELVFATTRGGDREIVSAKIDSADSISVSAKLSRNGDVKLFVDDQAVASGKTEGTLIDQPLDGLQFGSDTGGQVGLYTVPFSFQGKIENCIIEVQ